MGGSRGFTAWRAGGGRTLWVRAGHGSREWQGTAAKRPSLAGSTFYCPLIKSRLPLNWLFPRTRSDVSGMLGIAILSTRQEARMATARQWQAVPVACPESGCSTWLPGPDITPEEAGHAQAPDLPPGFSLAAWSRGPNIFGFPVQPADWLAGALFGGGGRRAHRHRYGGGMTKADDFDMFYAATSRRLVRQIFAMTGDLSEAEDAVQEAYIRAWRRWPRIRAYEDPEAWLRVVAYRITVNSWQKARNRLTAQRRAGTMNCRGCPGPGGAGERAAEDPRDPAPRHRAASPGGAVGREIARETGAPTGTVKARLARGRRALAPLVSEFDDSPQPGAAIAAAQE